MIRYVFRAEGPIIIRNRRLADPQRIGEALERARLATPRGEDMRETVVEEARDEAHAIHPHLEWDDLRAAHKFRIEQVNDLLRAIHIVDPKKPEDPGEPAFISVNTGPKERGFYSPGEIRRSADLQVAALEAAERDLAAFERRHRWLVDICAKVAGLRAELRRRREGTENRDSAA